MASPKKAFRAAIAVPRLLILVRPHSMIRRRWSRRSRGRRSGRLRRRFHGTQPPRGPVLCARHSLTLDLCVPTPAACCSARRPPGRNVPPFHASRATAGWYRPGRSDHILAQRRSPVAAARQRPWWRGVDSGVKAIWYRWPPARAAKIGSTAHRTHTAQRQLIARGQHAVRGWRSGHASAFATMARHDGQTQVLLQVFRPDFT